MKRLLDALFFNQRLRIGNLRFQFVDCGLNAIFDHWFHAFRRGFEFSRSMRHEFDCLTDLIVDNTEKNIRFYQKNYKQRSFSKLTQIVYDTRLPNPKRRPPY